MEKILFVNACVRPNSRTYILAKQLLSLIESPPKEQAMDSVVRTIEEVNLQQAALMPLDWERLQERDAYIQKKEFTAPIFQYARQFVEADEIVIAAPYWDLSFPSTLRIYFEAVTVTGLSFQYTPSGSTKGLCKAKRICYVTTAGGSIADYNLGYDYVKALAETFYGIPKVVCYQAQNLDVAGADVEKIMKEAANNFELGKGKGNDRGKEICTAD